MKALIAALRDPATVRHFTPADWEALLGEGRRTRMLARVHHLLAQSLADVPLPVGARDMLSGHARYVAHMHVLVRNELRRIGAVAAQVDYPVILLKGAAYLMAELPFAAGRGLSDIDVLVPRDALDDFERRLLAAGWEFDSSLSAYDDQYYRAWSHELPPMRHPDSSLELDVHHNLIQVTSRSALDAAPLIARAQPVSGTPFHVLAAPDRVLHSALHLLMSDELRGAFGIFTIFTRSADRRLRRMTASGMRWSLRGARCSCCDHSTTSWLLPGTCSALNSRIAPGQRCGSAAGVSYRSCDDQPDTLAPCAAGRPTVAHCSG